MKKRFTFFTACFILFSSYSQVYNYTFATAAGTWTALTSATNTHTGGFNINTAAVTVTIPAFKYYGFTYTTAQIFPTGFIMLSNGAVSNATNPINSGGSTSAATPYNYSPLTIAPFAGYLAGSTAGGGVPTVSYATVGSEFVVQWKDLKNDGGTYSGVGISFQARLNTTNGTIKFVYNNFTNATWSTAQGQIGIRRSVVPDDCRIVSAVGFPSIGTWAAPIIHSNVSNYDSGVSRILTGSPGTNNPTNGQTFTFTPSADCNSSFNVAGVTLVQKNPGVICKGQRAIIRATGLPTGSGFRFRWESSVNTSFPYTYTPVSGTFLKNDTTYELTTDTLMRNRVYQLKVTCIATGTVATTNPIAITVTDCSIRANMLGGGSVGFNSIAATGTSPTSWRNGANTDDNLTNNINVGLTFNFRGKQLSDCKISTNGFITFDAANDVTHNGAGTEFGSSPIMTWFIPSPNITQVIAPFYANLATTANDNTLASLQSSIKYQTTGTAPNRVFIVEWINMKYATGPTGTNFNFQLKMYEGSNVIQYVYGPSKWYTGQGISTELNNTTMGILSNPNNATIGNTYLNPVSLPENSPSFMLWNVPDSVKYVSNYYVTLQRGFQCNSGYTFYPSSYAPGLNLPNISANAAPPVISRDTNFTPAKALPLIQSTAGCTFNSTCNSADRIYVNSLFTPTTPGACNAYQDGWFKFTPFSNAMPVNISVRSVSDLDPIVSIYRENLTVVSGYSCINTTGVGGTETLNIPAGTLSAGTNYYLRVNSPNNVNYNYDDGFALCFDGTGTLPVRLIDFSGMLDRNNHAILNWKADQAINFSHFEIEHSTDGRNFTYTGKVDYNRLTTNFNFTHTNLITGKNYYRLKQVDKDGRFEYSRVVELIVKKQIQLSIMPTIITNQALVKVQLDKPAQLTLKIMNTAGMLIETKKVQLQNGNQQIALNLANLVAGTYIVNAFTNDAFISSTKIIKTN